MMLGEVIAMEPERLIEFDELQALGILLGKHHAVGIDMVEDAEFHASSLLCVTMSLPRRAEM